MWWIIYHTSVEGAWYGRLRLTINAWHAGTCNPDRILLSFERNIIIWKPHFHSNTTRQKKRKSNRFISSILLVCTSYIFLHQVSSVVFALTKIHYSFIFTRGGQIKWGYSWWKDWKSLKNNFSGMKNLVTYNKPNNCSGYHGCVMTHVCRM